GIHPFQQAGTGGRSGLPRVAAASNSRPVTFTVAIHAARSCLVGPKPTSRKTRTMPRLAGAKSRKLNRLALGLASPPARINVRPTGKPPEHQWPLGAGRYRHEAVLRAGHDIAHAPCRLAREWSFLCCGEG